MPPRVVPRGPEATPGRTTNSAALIDWSIIVTPATQPPGQPLSAGDRSRLPSAMSEVSPPDTPVSVFTGGGSATGATGSSTFVDRRTVLRHRSFGT